MLFVFVKLIFESHSRLDKKLMLWDDGRPNQSVIIWQIGNEFINFHTNSTFDGLMKKKLLEGCRKNTGAKGRCTTSPCNRKKIKIAQTCHMNMRLSRQLRPWFQKGYDWQQTGTRTLLIQKSLSPACRFGIHTQISVYRDHPGPKWCPNQPTHEKCQKWKQPPLLSFQKCFL